MTEGYVQYLSYSYSLLRGSSLLGPLGLLTTTTGLAAASTEPPREPASDSADIEPRPIAHRSVPMERGILSSGHSIP